MNKLQIQIKALTEKDFNPELVGDLIAGVLRSVNITLVSIEYTKVAEATILTRRTPRTKKTSAFMPKNELPSSEGSL